MSGWDRIESESRFGFFALLAVVARTKADNTSRPFVLLMADRMRLSKDQCGTYTYTHSVTPNGTSRDLLQMTRKNKETAITTAVRVTQVIGMKLWRRRSTIYSVLGWFVVVLWLLRVSFFGLTLVDEILCSQPLCWHRRMRGCTRYWLMMGNRFC